MESGRRTSRIGQWSEQISGCKLSIAEKGGGYEGTYPTPVRIWHLEIQFKAHHKVNKLLGVLTEFSKHGFDRGAV